MTLTRMSWEIAWKPILMLMVTAGRLPGDAIPENLATYGHMTEDDFAPRTDDGRVLIEVGQYP